MNIETIAVHAGADLDASTGAIAPPIHLSTTFEHGPENEDLHGHGYAYVRERNPTQTRLEEAMAKLEGGASALVFASGMAAGASLLQTLAAGSHVIFPDDMYMGFGNLARELLGRWGIEHAIVDTADPSRVAAAMKSNTRLLWLETPSNPRLRIADLRALCDVAHAAGARALVDNTFATPVLQRPLELGADVVLHSTTKYCVGHSDALGGALVFNEAGPAVDDVFHVRHVLGAAASPFNSWLTLRGLRSLACRMERHSANAALVAKAMAESPHVEVVHYPGLPSHPGHDVARRQMRGGFGGVVSIEVRGGRSAAVRTASKLRLFVNATSLGGTESLVEHRASTEGPSSRTPGGLLRLAVGLEHPLDLVEDLTRALEEAARG